MVDQADDLRKLVAFSPVRAQGEEVREPRLQKARVLSITSGKGGVGKTSIAINLAYALRQYHKKTLIIDADLGLANVNILLGLTAEWTLKDVIEQKKSISEIILTSPDQVHVLPAPSGVEEMTHLSIQQKLYLKSQFDLLDQRFDFILIDTAAGISANVMAFNQMAQTVIVVISPDPTSFADAYAVIKLLSVKYKVRNFRIITNNVRNTAEGRDIFQKLEKICQRFLSMPIHYLGSLSTDPKFVSSSRNQQIALKHYPKATISKEMQRIAELICGMPYNAWTNKNISYLLTSILNLG